MSNQPTPKHKEEAREIVRQTYSEGCAWHGPITGAHCLDLHTQRLEGRIVTALSSRDREIREVLEGLRTYTGCWCNHPHNHALHCLAARGLWNRLQS